MMKLNKAVAIPALALAADLSLVACSSEKPVALPRPSPTAVGTAAAGNPSVTTARLGPLGRQDPQNYVRA